MKNCIKCKIDITNRGNRFKYCEECSVQSKKESYKKYLNKDEVKILKHKYRKEYYKENKEKLKPIRKKWREDNSEKQEVYNRERYQLFDKERLSNYYKENKEDINQRRAEYRKSDEYKKWKRDANGVPVITSALTYSFAGALSEVEFGRPFFEAKASQNLNLGILYTSRITNAELQSLTTL